MTVLILGGTKEAHELAVALHGAGIAVTTSLAGRTPSPRTPPGDVRIGSFARLDLTPFDAIVDATHPFATRISDAAAHTGKPVLRLERPGFEERPGDKWRRVKDTREAAATMRAERAFLAIGHQATAFAGTSAYCLIRAITRPPGPLPRRHELILERPPFTRENEFALLARVDTLVTKDSGGDATKLDAARALGVEVIVIERPPAPEGLAVATVEEALKWVRTRATAPPRPRTRAR
jgi:precorrin-6A/cobalt-precorrin-6A reductase